MPKTRSSKRKNASRKRKAPCREGEDVSRSVYSKGFDKKRADSLGTEANKRLKKKEFDSIDVGFVEDLWQRMYLKHTPRRGL